MLFNNAVIEFLTLCCLFSLGLQGFPVVDQNTTKTANETLKPVEADRQIREVPLKKNDPLNLPKFEEPKNFDVKKVAAEIKSFGFAGLKEEKHIEAVPLDREGKINPEFHREIFLGNHENFETQIQNNEKKRKEKLTEIFHKADVDQSNSLSKDELLDFVYKNIQEHLQEAKDKNRQLFVLIDTDQDGKITWHEYLILYVKFHHVNITNITEIDNLENSNNPTDAKLQRELIKIRYRWVSSDRNGDNDLDIDEFLAFRHPEIGSNSFGYVVEDLMLQLDRNGDQKLSENEFAFVPPQNAESELHEDFEELNKRWLNEQKNEFREMDTDNDGKLTREELLQAYDPLNRGHAKKNVNSLFDSVDTNPKDGLLSLEEIIRNAQIFTDLRILDAERVLHEEI